MEEENGLTCFITYLQRFMDSFVVAHSFDNGVINKMLFELPIHSFLDMLASSEPAPGGGATAALNGAQGAALVSMVCNLTIGRQNYAEVEAEMLTIRNSSEQLRAQLTDLIHQDSTAFDGVMAAYRMPKATPEEKIARSAAIQDGLKQATYTPLRTLETCVAVLKLTPAVIAKGNINAASDAGAGMLTAYAGMMTAALNVRINLNAIKDDAFVAESESLMNELLAQGDATRQEAWALASERLGM